MSLSAKLQQRQNQSLVMTPQLAQSIKLLQLSHTELMDFVKDEIEKNPLLELASDRPEEAIRGVDPAEKSANTDASKETDGVIAGSVADDVAAQPDSSLENVYDTGTAGAEKQDMQQSQTSSTAQIGSASGTASIEEFDFIANVGETITLVAHLERQIALQYKNQDERRIATYIAHGLDDDGYFRECLQNTAQNCATTPDMVEWVLEQFHSFEPVGIGARTLAECLELQLRDKNRFDPAMQVLLENMDLLAKRDFNRLMRLCGVNNEDFNEMLQEIKALDPRPARSYEPVLAETVVPDILIKQTQLGDWNIELNPETLPRVLIDNEYHVELTAALGDTDGHEFITECMENANWLTKSLDQRAQTILKVAAEIVKKQDRFFTEGVQYLKPLTLKDVAESIKMHESTVSRVTSNKYLMCQQGTFELKYFFSSAIASSDGESAVSAEAVKYKIQQMVNAECPDSILSDEQIVNNLQQTGVSIARRTVAKYREALQISSSVERRRQKAGIL